MENNSLKTEEKYLGDNIYGSFKLKDIVEFYFYNAVSVAGSNGDAPAYTDYSHEIIFRMSQRFNLDGHRVDYLIAPLLGYGKQDGNGTIQDSPIEYRAVKLENSPAFLTRVFFNSIDFSVDRILDEIGPELERRFNEEFNPQMPEPVQYNRIEPFESWMKRVMNNSP